MANNDANSKHPSCTQFGVAMTNISDVIHFKNIRLLVPVLFVIYGLFQYADGNAQFAITVQVATLQSGTWQGIQASVAMLHPNNPPASIVATPVALTVYQPTPDSHFIEAGPVRDCRVLLGDCGALHPYVSMQKPSTSVTFIVDTTTNLVSGGNYGYKIDRVSSEHFSASFCDANGCRVLQNNVDLDRDNFPYLFIAGESDGPRFISSRASNASGKNTSNSWVNYCYDPSLTIINVSDGRVTPCVNNSWEISYAYRMFVPSSIR